MTRSRQTTALGLLLSLLYLTTVSAQQDVGEGTPLPPENLAVEQPAPPPPDDPAATAPTTVAPASQPPPQEGETAAGAPAQHQGDEQQAEQQPIPLSTSKPARQQPLLSSTAIVGNTVKNTQGEDLGSIRELMIDPQSGRVVYAVLSSGGILGTGEKTYAIPWETLQVGLGKEELVLEIDREKLQTPDALAASGR